MTQDDELLQVLHELCAALQENSRRNEHIVARAEAIQQQRDAGVPWTEIVAEEHKPLIVELLSQNLAVLSGIGSRLRRLEAMALHDEGKTMEEIGQLFGVTRQRVSELLRHAADNSRS